MKRSLYTFGAVKQSVRLSTQKTSAVSGWGNPVRGCLFIERDILPKLFFLFFGGFAQDALTQHCRRQLLTHFAARNASRRQKTKRTALAALAAINRQPLTGLHDCRKSPTKYNRLPGGRWIDFISPFDRPRPRSRPRPRFRASLGRCTIPRTILLCLSLALTTALADDKVTYQDQVLPLIEANCSKCHNADKKKADLDLTSYQSALQGSGSGSVVVSGNPDASKLWKALTHAEEPNMPPNRPRLPEKELQIFKQWIAGGLLESANGKAVPVSEGGSDLALKPGAAVRPEGPPPMPKDLRITKINWGIRGTALTGLAVSPWAPLLAVQGHEQVLLFNAETLACVGVLPFPEGEPVHLAFSRNGKILLAAGGRGAASGRVAAWDVVTGKRLATLGQEYDTMLAADIRNDQTQVAFGGPTRLVKILNTSTGDLQHKLKKHTDWVTAVTFSPNGHMLASADRNGGVIVWDPESGQELFTLAGHKASVTALSWRDDSKLLASSSEDGSVKLWEMQEGKQVKSWNAHAPGVLSVSYSHEGRLVSCGRDGQVVVWEASGNRLRKMDYAGELPLRVVFTDDGKRVVTTDFKGEVAVWNVADGKRAGGLEPRGVSFAGR